MIMHLILAAERLGIQVYSVLDSGEWGKSLLLVLGFGSLLPHRLRKGSSIRVWSEREKEEREGKGKG